MGVVISSRNIWHMEWQFERGTMAQRHWSEFVRRQCAVFGVRGSEMVVVMLLCVRVCVCVCACAVCCVVRVCLCVCVKVIISASHAPIKTWVLGGGWHVAWWHKSTEQVCEAMMCGVWCAW